MEVKWPEPSYGQSSTDPYVAPLSVHEANRDQYVHKTGRSWAEPQWDMPRPGTAENEPVSAEDVLKQSIAARMQQIDQEFGSQERQLKQLADQKLRQLEGQYNIEQRYIVNAAGMDREQKIKQVQQLNKKYELKIAELQNGVAPKFREFEAGRQKLMWDIQAAAANKQIELGVIDRLVRQGVIADPQVALQQKLQAVGVNLPISLVRQKSITPKQQLQDAQYELRVIESALENFRPANDGGWLGRAKPLRYTPTGYDEELKKATPEQRDMFKQLSVRQAELRQQIAGMVTGVHRFTRAMDNAAALRDNPLASKVKELVRDNTKSKAISNDPLGLF